MGMITLRLKNINKGKNVDWIYTNWEVGTSKNFDESKLIFTSYEDRDNKASILTELTLLPGTKYYARAQVVTNKGAHKWTNLDTWIHKAYDEVENQSDLPSKINSPHLYTDSDKSNHIPTGFYILTHDFGSTADSVHTATSYWIETLDGHVVWKNLYNEVERYKILVDDVILHTDRIYRIKAVFHSSSNDISQVSTKTVYIRGTTQDVNAIRISKSIKKNNFDTSQDINTLLYVPKGSKSCVVRILAYMHAGSNIAYEGTVDLTKPKPHFSIPSSKLKDNTIYLLLIHYDNNLSWSHIVFNTFD